MTPPTQFVDDRGSIVVDSLLFSVVSEVFQLVGGAMTPPYDDSNI